VIPIVMWQRTSAGINSLAFSEDDKTLLVAGHDGLPYRVSVVDPARPRVLQELAGYNCDPVAAIRSSSSPSSRHSVLAAGKDGCVKIWNLS
jgi:WD40 repeat protein